MNPISHAKFGRPAHDSIALILVALLLCALLVSPCLSLADQKAIKIAAIYSYSGPLAGASITSVRGVQMAVKEINAAGGIIGRRLELLEIDNLSTPIGAKQAALRAVQNNVAAIIGAAFSTHSIAVAHVAQDHGIPMITNISTSPLVTRIGNYIFRVCYNDLFQGEVMGRFARKELKARTVVTAFNVASDYSLGLSRTFEAAFLEAGGVSLARLPYKTQQPNFRNLVEQVKSIRPDALFIAGHGESARIAQEAAQMGIQSIPLGGDGWDDDSFYNLGGDKIKLGYYTTHWSQSIETEASRQFIARHGHSGVILAPTVLAYDAVNLLADAITRAGSVQRIKIRNTLAETKDFKGVTGTINFDAYGDPVKSVVIMKIQEGRRIYLKQVHPGPAPMR